MVNRQRGAGLLEVMIGLFVLAVGMLGFMGLLSSSMTMSQRANTLSQATFFAEEIADRARANRGAVSDYGINFSEDTTATSAINPKCDSADCTEVEMATWDMAQWMETLQQVLPGGDAEIIVNTVGGVTEMQITISYNLRLGREGTGSSANLGTLEQFQMVTEI